MLLVPLVNYPGATYLVYFLHSFLAQITTYTQNLLFFFHFLIYLDSNIAFTITMAYSLTVAALLHPWSGRIDIASRLPLRRNESAISNSIPFPVDRYPTTVENYKTRRKSLSVDLPWILRGQRDAAEYEVAEEEESTRLLFPSSRTLLSVRNRANEI